MKEVGTTNWNSPNTGATNESGFSGLPGGKLDINGTFNNVGGSACWWSSNEYTNSYSSVWTRILFYDSSIAKRNIDDKKGGFSVRCLKD